MRDLRARRACGIARSGYRAAAPWARRAVLPAAACGLLQGCDLVAADRRRHHHHRGGVEAAALDQVANGAVDAGADTVIVGAQPDPARRRGIVHSAAVRSTLSAALASARFSLCSATK